MSPGCSTNHMFSTSKVPPRSLGRAGAPRRSRKALFRPAGAAHPAKSSAFVATDQKLSGRLPRTNPPLVHGRNCSKIGAYLPSTFHTKPRVARAKKSWRGARGIPRFAEFGRNSKRNLAAPAVAFGRVHPFAPLPEIRRESAIQHAICRAQPRTLFPVYAPVAAPRVSPILPALRYRNARQRRWTISSAFRNSSRLIFRDHT